MKRRVVEVKNLSKTYDLGEVRVQALRNVSLHVDEGEFVAIMGPSGSGKSTFMNILGCLDKPTSGDYFIKEQKVSEISADALADIRNELIGFVFQGFNLLSKNNAIENVEIPLFYARRRTYSQKERRELSESALHIVGLGERMHHLPKQLSGGQQQRVAIARAIVTNPSLILADEPTGNLDSRTSVEIMKIFQDFNRKKGITVILVTHSNEIAEYADRVIVFRDGRVREDRKVENRIEADEALKLLPPPEEDLL